MKAHVTCELSSDFLQIVALLSQQAPNLEKQHSLFIDVTSYRFNSELLFIEYFAVKHLQTSTCTCLHALFTHYVIHYVKTD